MYKILIFDLDGTLFDTLPDIYSSLHYVLKKNKLSVPSIDMAKIFIGDGLKTFLKRAINYSKGNEENLDLIFNDYLEHYGNNCINNTTVYNGIYEVLDYAFNHNIKMAVVSNKSEIFVKKIINHFNMDKYFSPYIYGGDSFTEKKPSSLPINNTIKNININDINNDEIMIIGDSKNDVIAGFNANIKTCLCSYGYGFDNTLNPNYTINHPTDIINIIK